MKTSVEKLRPVEVLWILSRETRATMNAVNTVKSVSIDLGQKELIEIPEINDIRELTSMNRSRLMNIKYEKYSSPDDSNREFEKEVLQDSNKRLYNISYILEDYNFQDLFESHNIYTYSNEKDSVSLFGKEIYKKENQKIERVDSNWEELQRQIMKKDRKLKKKFRVEGDIPDEDVAYIPVFDTVSRWAVDFSRYWDVDEGYKMGR
jgi:ABC-type Zn2+ transport system substrate-binding protein/surface adhesin